MKTRNYIFNASPEAEGRLDRWLSEQIDTHSRSQIRRAIDDGAATVNGQAQVAKYKIHPGDEIAIDLPDPESGKLVPEDIPLDIVREDEHILVVNKPAGMVVHPAPGHERGTLAGALLAHCGPSLREVGGEERWGIVHRLDRNTSGLMVAAKTPEAYEALVTDLASHGVRRRYLALTVGEFHGDTGTIDQPIGRRPGDRKRMGIVREGRRSVTHWRAIWQEGPPALMGLALETGRTHQIRVHLQSFGRPVLGDPDYGWTRKRTMQAFNAEGRQMLSQLWPDRQMLHAVRLAFRHPVHEGEVWDLRSAIPGEMLKLIEAFHENKWETAFETWMAEPVEWPADPVDDDEDFEDDGD